MSSTSSHRNEQLQAKLRAAIEADSLYSVAERLDIGREALARYLAGLKLNTSTLRGIEVSIEAMEPRAKEEPGGLL
jgi:hypothetical protein